MELIDRLVDRSVSYAMHGAAEALRSLRIQDPDFEAIQERVKARSIEAWDQALGDAREALDCGMGQVAEATWAATFKLVGIQAVRDVHGEEV